MAEPCQRETQSFCLPSDPLALRKPGNWLANCLRASGSHGEAVPDVISEALNVDHVGRSILKSSELSLDRFDLLSLLLVHHTGLQDFERL